MTWKASPKSQLSRNEYVIFAFHLKPTRISLVLIQKTRRHPSVWAFLLGIKKVKISVDWEISNSSLFFPSSHSILMLLFWSLLRTADRISCSLGIVKSGSWFWRAVNELPILQTLKEKGSLWSLINLEGIAPISFTELYFKVQLIHCTHESYILFNNATTNVLISLTACSFPQQSHFYFLKLNKYMY